MKRDLSYYQARERAAHATLRAAAKNRDCPELGYDKTAHERAYRAYAHAVRALRLREEG